MVQDYNPTFIYLRTSQTLEGFLNFIIDLTVTAMLKGGLLMGEFCLAVEFHRGGFASKGATPSNLIVSSC